MARDQGKALRRAKPGQGGEVPVVRYRLRRSQYFFASSAGSIGVVIGQAIVWADGGDFDRSIFVQTLIFIGFSQLLVGLLIYLKFSVTLTPSTVIVRNLSRRKIRWSDIQAIMIEKSAGTRSIVLYEANGRRTQLRAPTTGFLFRDSRFDEKFHTIGGMWLERRGPYWYPVQAPQWPAWGSAIGGSPQ